MNAVELIKSFKNEDYLNNNVNLHIHSACSDGKTEFRTVVDMFSKKYKYISVTDHNTVQGYIDNSDVNIITGVEFDVWYKGIFLHLLAYGIDIHNDEMKRFYAKNKQGTKTDIIRFFSTRNIKKLINAIHNAGGIAVLAHPACCWAINLNHFVGELVKIGLDGVEVFYPYPRWRKYIKFSNPEDIDKIADKYNLIKTGGTDFH